MNKGGKFKKNCGAASVGVYKMILFYQLSWSCKIAAVKSS